jgi:hypothetical protein
MLTLFNEAAICARFPARDNTGCHGDVLRPRPHEARLCRVSNSHTSISHAQLNGPHLLEEYIALLSARALYV